MEEHSSDECRDMVLWRPLPEDSQTLHNGQELVPWVPNQELSPGWGDLSFKTAPNPASASSEQNYLQIGAPGLRGQKYLPGSNLYLHSSSDLDNGTKSEVESEAETKDNAEEAVASTGPQNKAVKRKRSTKLQVAPNKRREAEQSLFNLAATHIIKKSSLPSTDLTRDATVFGQATNTKLALDKLFNNLSQDEITHSKAEFLFAIRAFKPPGSIKPYGSEKWILKGMKTAFFHHQLLGAGWMRRIETDSEKGGPKGGILADDMGLGKTLQILALIMNSKPSSETAPATTLVVVPNGTIGRQWMREICQHWESRHNSHNNTASSGNGDGDVLELMNGARAFIVTYSSILSSMKRNGPFHQRPFLRVVFDEAHEIRNHTSQTFKACALLEAKYKWMVTGTPLINGIDDLFSYCQLLEFRGIDSIGDFRKLTKEEKGKPQKYPKLKKLTKGFILSRKKNTPILGRKIVDLPITRYKTIYTDLQPHEKRLYSLISQEINTKIGRYLCQFGKTKVAESYDSSCNTNANERKEIICRLILLLRQAVGSPLLIWARLPAFLETEQASYALVKELTVDSGIFQSGTNAAQRESARLLMSPGIEESEQDIADEAPRPTVSFWFKRGGMLLHSAKLLAAREQIAIWIQNDPSQKILVFTQFVDMALIFEQMCELQGWKCALYTGRMNVQKRERSVQLLKEDPKTSILIMTLQSGGVGLDLFVASRVLIFDLWWNQALEKQASSRIERIGQTHEMEIVRIAANETIDDHVLRIQEKKSSQIDSVMGGKHFSQGLTLQEIREIAKDPEAANLAALPELDGQDTNDGDSKEESFLGEEVMNDRTENCVDWNGLTNGRDTEDKSCYD